MGGRSSEREISLKSGDGILQALLSCGCQAVGIDLTSIDVSQVKETIACAHIDMAFIALHGFFGEDGQIQRVLDEMAIPYTGAGSDASHHAFDKCLTKNICQESNIMTPGDMTINKGQGRPIRDILKTLEKFPVVVKPPREGSSIGVSIVEHGQDLLPALNIAWQYGPDAIVEEFIKGREMTVGVVGSEALPVVEIQPAKDFYNYKAKYTEGMTEYTVPARLTEDKTEEMQHAALKACQSVDCLDLSRVDFILSEDFVPYLLEINTIPGFTGTSLLPRAARQSGLNYSQLCLKILDLAYAKKKEEKNFSVIN